MIPAATMGSISFNTNANYMLSGVPGLSSPSIRRSSYDLAGADGGVLDNALYGRRRFSLQGMIIGSTLTEYIALRDAFVTQLANYKSSGTLSFTRGDGLTLYVAAGLVGQFDLDPTPDLPFACNFNLPMEMVSTCLTASAVMTSISPAATGGGTVPATVPMSLSANASTNQFFTNHGNASADLSITFTGPVVNPSLRNLTTQQDMLLTVTLAAGESITVNTLTHSVLDNTGRSRRDTFSGAFWQLQPGVNQILYTLTSTTGSTTASLTVADSYLSL